MKKSSSKRLPHGATKNLVLAEIWKLYSETGKEEPVSRAQLVKELTLPETTINDRLRDLIKDGAVVKVSRGLYKPRKKNRPLFFDNYGRQRRESLEKFEVPRADYQQEGGDTTQSLFGVLTSLQSAGIGQKLNPLLLPDGSVVLRLKMTQEEFLKLESQRQKIAYLDLEN